MLTICSASLTHMEGTNYCVSIIIDFSNSVCDAYLNLVCADYGVAKRFHSLCKLFHLPIYVLIYRNLYTYLRVYIHIYISCYATGLHERDVIKSTLLCKHWHFPSAKVQRLRGKVFRFGST